MANRCAACSLLALALLTTSAVAQTGVLASAGLTVADHRVDAGYGVERHHGILPGLGLAYLGNSRVDLGLRARKGTLSGDDGSLDLSFSEIGVLARFNAVEWLALDGGITVRHFSNALGAQRWLMLRVGVEGHLPMFAGAGGGILRASYAPVTRVSGLATELALSAGAGLEYSAGPARMRVLYEVERFRFVPVVDATRRHEQFATVTAELSLSISQLR